MLTLQDYIKRVTVSRGPRYGVWRVGIKYRNKRYRCLTTNTWAVTWRSQSKFPLNQRRALMELYIECQIKNGLKKGYNEDGKIKMKREELLKIDFENANDIENPADRREWAKVHNIALQEERYEIIYGRDGSQLIIENSTNKLFTI